MANDKYHAEIRFGFKRTVRYTAVDLERLMRRFKAEVDKEQQRVIDAKEYTYVVPSLITEFCGSWAQFDQYEH